MLKVCIKYSMCDLICNVISCCVYSCNMGKITDKIMIEKKKNGIMEIKEFFYINLHLIDGLGMDFTAC